MTLTKKQLLVVLAMCSLAFPAQVDPAGQRKHLSIPTATHVRPISVSALNVERELQYPSIIHLSGSVEIRTSVCVAAGSGSGQRCDGYVVLHADKADFYEDSGRIQASGTVTVTREK